jgi:hypothetical protein
MSTATLTSLLDYLYGTLSPNNMRWVGERLIEYAKKEENAQLRPYTMQEIDKMLDEAEAAFEAGEYLTNDEVFFSPLPPLLSCGGCAGVAFFDVVHVNAVAVAAYAVGARHQWRLREAVNLCFRLLICLFHVD